VDKVAAQLYDGVVASSYGGAIAIAAKLNKAILLAPAINMVNLGPSVVGSFCGTVIYGVDDAMVPVETLASFGFMATIIYVKDDHRLHDKGLATLLDMLKAMSQRLNTA
jgi:hypothetical protein